MNVYHIRHTGQGLPLDSEPACVLSCGVNRKLNDFWQMLDISRHLHAHTVCEEGDVGGHKNLQNRTHEW